MSVYELLTQHPRQDVQYVEPKIMDNDVRQDALFRTLRTFTNKGNDPQDFVDFCHTDDGARSLRKALSYAQLDLVRGQRMANKKNKKYRLGGIPDNEKKPLSTSLAPTLRLIEDLSESTETDIQKVQRRIEMQDRVKSLYANGTDSKRKAMDLLVEIMNLRDEGKVVPARMRMSLSRLRVEIQETDPSWKLDLSGL